MNSQAVLIYNGTGGAGRAASASAVSILFVSLWFVAGIFNGQALAESNTSGLPFINDIDHIVLEQQPQQTVQIYTDASLLNRLDNFQRAGISPLMGFGKVWLWQRGEFVLKNGNRVRWRTFARNILLVETEDGPEFYTDASATTRKIVGNKMITTVYTPDGQHEFEISLLPSR